MTNKPVVNQIAWTVALLLSGVAAGMFLMNCFGYYPLLPRLADHAAIQLHQESVALHRGLFRLAIQSSGTACLVMIIFFSEGTSRWLLIASLTCLIALIVYTNYALIPLNREIGTWTPASPPPDWKMLFSEPPRLRSGSRSTLRPGRPPRARRSNPRRMPDVCVCEVGTASSRLPRGEPGLR